MKLVRRLIRAAIHVGIRALSSLEELGTASHRHDVAKTGSGPHETQGSAAIVLTTFSDRFYSHALPTLNKLEEANLNREVFLVVNGDQGSRFDPVVRQAFLQKALEIMPVSPVCFGVGRGMAEMWNVGARLSSAEKVIFLNEDLMIDPSRAVEAIEAIESELDSFGLVILNDSFGHFGVTREALRTTGWFDERFLGFGEEDGDFIWRFLQHYPNGLSRLRHPGINNLSSSKGYERLDSSQVNKYSEFNYQFLRAKYSFVEGPPEGSFGSRAIPAFPEPNRFPEDSFKRHFSNLSSKRGDEVRLAILSFLAAEAKSD